MIAAVALVVAAGILFAAGVKGKLDAPGDNAAILSGFRGIVTLERGGVAFIVNEDTALKDGDRIVFLRRVAPGVAEKSFGIHVAAMAGLPAAVVDRAGKILANLEANDLDVDAPKIVRRPRRKLSDIPGQMTLF